jgi:hypothetical protein
MNAKKPIREQRKTAKIPPGSTKSVGKPPLWVVWQDQDGDPVDWDDRDAAIHRADIVDEVGQPVLSLIHRECGWTGFLDRAHPRADEVVEFANLVFGETLESIR